MTSAWQQLFVGVETWKKRDVAHTCTTWQVIAACAISKSPTTAKLLNATSARSKSTFNSSQRRQTRRLTRHTILRCDELTVWRVDWFPLKRSVWSSHTSRFNGTEPFRSRSNSLPGVNRPIEPWPIRSLELSLPGLFTPWPSRSLEPSLPGPFTPWPSRYSINRIIFAALAYSLYRPMTWC